MAEWSMVAALQRVKIHRDAARAARRDVPSRTADLFGKRIVDHPLARRQLLKSCCFEQALPLCFMTAYALDRSEAAPEAAARFAFYAVAEFRRRAMRKSPRALKCAAARATAGVAPPACYSMPISAIL